MTERTVVVTGGASGIGKRTAELFAEDGAYVVVADVNADGGEPLVRSMGMDRAMFLRLDVSDEAAVEAAFDDIARRRGKVDILFNNAGVADARASLLDIDIPQFRRVTDVILLGAMLMTKYAVPLMRETGGVIINTTSVTGERVSGGSCVYAAAKAGLINFTRYAAVELGPLGIRVNGVCPGGVVTPLLRASIGEAADRIEAAGIRAGVAAGQAITHVNEPEDIAHAVLFLASERAKGITGHNLVVDGGYMVANRGISG